MENQNNKPEEEQLLHPTGIREHTDGRGFRPFGLLVVTLVIAATLAAVSYAVQILTVGAG